MTDINNIIGRKLTTEVATDVELLVEVLSEDKVKYQFVGHDDNTEDVAVVTELELKFDDVESKEDYGFTTEIGATYFLGQLDVVS